MKYIPYQKSMGSVELTTLTFRIAKALRSTNPDLAIELITSQADVSKEVAREVLASIANIDEYCYRSIVDWSVNAEFEITDGEWYIINSLYRLREPQKILSIKFLREQYTLRLKEAKDICDYIGAQPC